MSDSPTQDSPRLTRKSSSTMSLFGEVDTIDASKLPPKPSSRPPPPLPPGGRRTSNIPDSAARRPSFSTPSRAPPPPPPPAAASRAPPPSPPAPVPAPAVVESKPQVSDEERVNNKKTGFYNMYAAKPGTKPRQSTIISRDSRTRSASTPVMVAQQHQPPDEQVKPGRKSSAFVPDDHFDASRTFAAHHDNPLPLSGPTSPSKVPVPMPDQDNSCPSDVLMRASISHIHDDVSALQCQKEGIEKDKEQALFRKTLKEQQKQQAGETKEDQRMSVMISAGASTDVALEVFAEFINSVGRLRTSLSSQQSKGGPSSHNSDFEKALNRISAALHSALKVLDALRENIEPKGQWAWGPYAKRLSSDLRKSNELLSQIRILLVTLYGANAMVDVTSLVDKMSERTSLRVSDLEATVTAWEVELQTKSANCLKTVLVDKKGFEKERERLQIIAEDEVVAQKCHKSGELDKLPIVKRALVVDKEEVHLGMVGEQRAKSASMEKAVKTAAAGQWRKRYFYLDYEALTYTHNVKSGQSLEARPGDTTSTSLEMDHTTTAFTVDEKNQPGVFTIVHTTYEFTMRAESVDEGYLWVNALNKIGGVHRAKNDRERKWFADKSQNQWWGDMVPNPHTLSAKNWEKLFASVIMRWPMKTADLITPTKKIGNFRSVSENKDKAVAAGVTSNMTQMSQSMSHVFVVPGGADVGTGVSVGLASRLRGHEDHVTSLSWSSDGQHVVSGSKECRVLVWDTPASSTLQIPEPPNQGTSASAAASAAAVAAGLGVMKPAEELNMGSAANWTLASCFSPSNRFVAVAGLNQKISVGDWRYQHGRSYALHPIGNGDEHLGAVSALCWMGKEDGVLASGCSDSYLRIWDVTSRKMITRLDAQEDEVQCLAAHDWVPSVVLSGGADCHVRIHDARNARSCVGILKGAESDVQDVRIFTSNSTTANFVASASRDGYCRIHDLRQPASPVMTTLVAENRGFTGIDFSPDGRWLYVAAARNEWNVVDAYTGHNVLKVNGHTGIVNCLRATPDGRVCTGSDDHQLLVWNVEMPTFW